MAKQLVNTIQGGIGSAYDRPNKRILVAEWAGQIRAVDINGGDSVLGRGYKELEDIVVSNDGSWALVSERGGSLLQVRLSDGDRRRARVVVDKLSAPHQIALFERIGTAYVIEFGRNGRLLEVQLGTGKIRVLQRGFRRAAGLLLDRNMQRAYISEQSGFSGRVMAVDFRSGHRKLISGVLVNPFMLSWADEMQTALLVTERDPANRLTRIDLATGKRTVLLDGLDFRPSSAALIDANHVAVIADSTVTLHDLTPEPALMVDFDLGTDPLFVGEYRRVPVKIVGSGASFNDLEFEVVEGPIGGLVSYSRDETFSPAKPEIMLLGGYQPGGYTLVARHKVTGDELGVVTFEVSELWTGDDGPPLWFQGISQPAVTGSTWGGGPSGPQNVDISPATGTRNVAILFADTATQRYPANPSATITKWRNEFIDGVSVGGVTRSSRLYFQEVSQGEFDLSLEGMFGPVQLSGDFEDHFNMVDGLWKYDSGFFQSAVTAGNGLIDYGNIESLVVVVQSAPAVDVTDPDASKNSPRFAWPFATYGTFKTIVDGEEIDQYLTVVVMPHDWDVQDGRLIHETLSHELGHNIGLPDLYMNDDEYGAAIADRDVDSFDLMSQEDPLPHLSTPLKMRVGWIRPAWIKQYNFQASGAVDETVTLFASELGEPPAGQFSAVEVRLADGWNYYFEYRSEQSGQLADQSLSTDRRVVGTDVISDPFTAPIPRRQVILLRNDPDGDGPILGDGQNYEETDATDPMFPTDFSVEVVSTNDDTAQIRIRYGANSRPDPSIRPWPGSGINAWQSPDIEVRNDKNDADSSLINLPWTNHPNRIVAKIKNVGSLLAKDVIANFSVKDFNLGKTAVIVPLGFDVNDIPAGDTVEFELDGWVPATDGHYCVQVQIPLYFQEGPPVVVEMTEYNNMAQSNYTEFISAEASPPARQRGFIKVGNPYSKRTRIHILGRQTNPLFRTYLGQTAVWLDPDEEREIEFMVEALHGTPHFDHVLQHNPKADGMVRLPNHVNVAGYAESPHDRQVHTVQPTGGVNIRVRTGKATSVNAGADGDTVFGQVVDADGKEVPAGKVIVTVREPGDLKSERTAVGTVEQGHFSAKFDFHLHEEGFEASAEYLGQGSWAPSPPFIFKT